MPMEHGFFFKITGEVFVPRKSASAADVADAMNRAEEARIALTAALSDIPVKFTISDSMARSRRLEEDGVDPNATP